MTRHICLHGAESTGKSTLAPRLAFRLGALVVTEYGRTYCEANGTDLDTDAEFLGALPGQRLLVGLAGLDLAAGELSPAGGLGR